MVQIHPLQIPEHQAGDQLNGVYPAPNSLSPGPSPKVIITPTNGNAATATPSRSPLQILKRFTPNATNKNEEHAITEKQQTLQRSLSFAMNSAPAVAETTAAPTAATESVSPPATPSTGSTTGSTPQAPTTQIRTIIVNPTTYSEYYESEKQSPLISQANSESSKGHTFFDLPDVIRQQELLPTNAVHTHKYTLWNFLIKNLYEQFRRLSNIYFLLISILQLTTTLSPTSKYATAAPLAIVLTLTGLKDAIEDYARYVADRQVNQSRCLVWRAKRDGKKQKGEWVEKYWHELRVGDIVKVHNQQSIPADLAIIHSSNTSNNTEAGAAAAKALLPAAETDVDGTASRKRPILQSRRSVLPDDKSSPSTAGLVYIETSNLDGESNLKLKQSISQFQTQYTDVNSLANLVGRVECEQPNKNLYRFEGSFYTYHSPHVPVQIDINHMAWRGTVLSNTTYIYGLVVFTGKDTKLIRNSTTTPSKRSVLDVAINSHLAAVWVILAVLCTVATILNAEFVSTLQSINYNTWYVPFLTSRSGLVQAEQWLTFLILLNDLVPISLYVTFEIVKVIQAHVINHDVQMYDQEKDCACTVRTSSLNEDLGQVQYIFSDKTGTLTCNQMELHKVSVSGCVYGDDLNGTHHKRRQMLQLTSALGTGRTHRRLRSFSTAGGGRRTSAFSALSDNVIPEDQPYKAKLKGYNLADEILNEVLDDKTHAHHKEAHWFALGMAVCHTVIPQQPPPGSQPNHESAGDSYSNITYQASSPDEVALVIAARQLGYILIGRDSRSIRIYLSRTQQVCTYEILQVLEFSSDRKCMSIIVRCSESRQIYVMSKGADEVMFPRLACIIDQQKNSVTVGSERMTATGSVSFPDASADPSQPSANRFDPSRFSLSVQQPLRATPPSAHPPFTRPSPSSIHPYTSLESAYNAQTHITEFGSEGLRTLVVGVKLLNDAEYQHWQQRYKQAEASISEHKEEHVTKLCKEIENGLELCGCTAIEDKLQDGVGDTIQQLFSAGIKVFLLTGDTLETARNIGFSCHLLNNKMQLVRLDGETSEEVGNLLATTLKQHSSMIGKQSDTLSVILTGMTLGVIFNDADLKLMFLELCKMARCVIACRVIPAQKADLVKMIRFGVPTQPVTLAIGDGANDVAMLQSAHVGIGISGNEGQQAVRSSDYSFSQFRFLTRLLLIHGRWNYYRLCKVVLYSFYKNIVYVLILFAYQTVSQYSGTILFDSWLGTCWNVLFTLLPIFVYGVLDQDLSEATVLQFPTVYELSQQSHGFDLRIFITWILNSIVHAVVIFYLPYLCLSEDLPAHDGKPLGLTLFGVMVNACAVVTVNVKLLLEMNNITWVAFLTVLASMAVWVVFLAAYSHMLTISWTFFGVINQIFSRTHFWFLLLLVPTICITVDLVTRYIIVSVWPNTIDVLKEYEQVMKVVNQHAATEGKKRPSMFVNDTFNSAGPSGLASPPVSHQRLNRGQNLSSDAAVDLVRSFHIDAAPPVPVYAHRPSVSSTNSMMSGVPGVNAASLLDASDNAGLEYTWQQSVADKLEHLRRILSGDEKAIYRKHAYYQQSSLSTAGMTGLASPNSPSGSSPLADAFIPMNRLTLSFNTFPQLEQEFRAKYINKSIRYTRVAFITVWCFLALYSIIAVFRGESGYIARIVLTGIAGVALTVLYTPFFQTYYNDIMCFVLIISAVARTLLVNQTGSISLAIFCIICFLLLRLRFILACTVTTIDLCFYVIWMIVKSRYGYVALIQVIFWHCCVVVFCGLTCKHIEQVLRRDFLLQKIHAHEQSKTQQIVDNIIPAHIAKQMAEKRRQQRSMALANVVTRKNALRRVFTQTGHNLITSVRNSSKLFGHRDNTSNGGNIQVTGATAVGATPSHNRGHRPSWDSSIMHASMTAASSYNTENDRMTDAHGIYSPLSRVTSEVRAFDRYIDRQNTDIIANQEPSVSILFCDLVGFSTFISSATPRAVVAILDAVYSTFDELCEHFGCRKMETVGKTYMACAGLRGTRADHAHAVAELAYQMVEIMATVKDAHGEAVAIRIGIHTGNVISGVVGLKRPQFSLFGDTVNTASRMQSTGAAGRVHVSSSTWAFLHTDYTAEQQVITAKGKGKMKTYLLKERTTPLHSNTRKTVIREDDVSVSEMLALITQSGREAIDDVDPYMDSDESIILDPYTLTFVNSKDEDEFRSAMTRTISQATRRPIQFAIIFYTVTAFLELFVDSNYDVRDLSDAQIGTVLTFRFAFLLLAIGVHSISNLDVYQKRSSFVLSSLFIIAMVGALFVPYLLDQFGTNGYMPCISLVFCITLISNAGVLQFIPTVLMNLVALTVWCIFEHAIPSYDGSPDSKDLLTSIALTFQVMAGCVINVFACYNQWILVRREYVFTNRVSKEKERAEVMLFQMLPEYVANELKLGLTVNSKKYEGVTILYSDIKGFTKYSSSCTPDAVVKLLSTLFSAFDQLTDKHSVYKVQTIGDAYVVVGGFPFQTSKRYSSKQHAINVINFGFDMLAVVKRVKIADSQSIEMRIGIHTGDIIAGCIGTKQLRYDIWGNSCLVANTMESNGIPSGIVISGTTADLVKDTFQLVELEAVEVKGSAQPIKKFAIRCPRYDQHKLLRVKYDENAELIAANSLAPTSANINHSSTSPTAGKLRVNMTTNKSSVKENANLKLPTANHVPQTQIQSIHSTSSSGRDSLANRLNSVSTSVAAPGFTSTDSMTMLQPQPTSSTMYNIAKRSKSSKHAGDNLVG